MAWPDYRGYNGNANTNNINSSKSERGREVSLGTGTMYTIPFNVNSMYINPTQPGDVVHVLLTRAGTELLLLETPYTLRVEPNNWQRLFCSF